MPTNVNGFAVFGAIEQKWLSIGGLGGALRAPTSNEAPTFDGVGRYQLFQGGRISWHPELGAYVVWGLIAARWVQLGAERFGYPITDEGGTPDGRGRFNHFRAVHMAGKPESSIYWHPDTGAHEIIGAIRTKWMQRGWERSPVGYPLDAEQATFDGKGRSQRFQGGVISWHPETGAQMVQGVISARWVQIGAEHYGYPITDEGATPDGRGRFNHFRAVHVSGKPESSIYWHPDTGAHEVFGAIRGKWAQRGWERSPAGYPLDAEHPAFDGVGRSQRFQGGIVSWHPETGAQLVQGAIAAQWTSIGAEKFGYPITDETPTPDGRGRFNHFRTVHVAGKPEASIYWHPDTGAHEVFGAIRGKWAQRGWEKSPIGYPIDSEHPTFDNAGRAQRFQGGVISWHPETGAQMVQGLIAARWTQIGAEKYGYPITDEMTTPDGRGRYNHFRALQISGKPEASIYWHPDTGAHEIYGAIRGLWATRGWETSQLGYPVGHEVDRQGAPGRVQAFQHGSIVWSPDTGAFCDPLSLSAPIKSGGLAALGGWFTMTVNQDGSVRWQGHAHDSGADGYTFGISALLRPPSGRVIAFAHTGHVGGTFTPGSRDHNWDQLAPSDAIIRSNLAHYSAGKLETNIEYTSDLGSALEKALSWLLKFGVGALLTPVGVVTFVGVEIGSLISTGSLVPGARLAEGVLWMAGPANTLFAIAAAGIASLGSKTRQLTQEEYDWANNEVFKGALPPRDRIVLTDTIGGQNRAFTFPRFDGKITLNMGPAAFADPRNYQLDRRKQGEVFIHELVHACQIQHASMDLSLLADALASKVCEATGGNPYLYGQAGADYSTFNLEQQAQIVSDWFAGNARANTNQSSTPKDEASPYFRYIQNNVRIGRF